MTPDWTADLRCPLCRAPLAAEGDAFRCACGRRYPVVRGVPYLLPDGEHQALETIAGWSQQWATPAFFPNRERMRPYVDPDLEIGVWQLPRAWFRGKRCLDAGCGDGRQTRFLRDLGADVRSMDLSEAVHTLAAKPDLAGAPVVRADVTLTPPWPDSYFDFVLCSGVLQHTRDPGGAIRGFVKVLKPGGYLFGSFYPVPERWTGRAKDRLMAAIRWGLSFLPTRAIYHFSRLSIPTLKYAPLRPLGRAIFNVPPHDRSDEAIWLYNHDNYVAGWHNTYTRDEALALMRDAGLEEIREAPGYPNNLLGRKPPAR